MKVFFKTLFIFFCFIFLQGFCTPNQTQEVLSHVNYIQNDYQKVILTSETMRGSEICITQSSDNSNSSAGRANASFSDSLETIYLTKVRPINFGSFIHNLSTSLSTEIVVRAP